LKDCLDSFTSVEVVELTCTACGSKDGFSKRSLFKTFPEVLAVNARRFVLINWVPTKVNVAVVVGDGPFSLDAYKSNGVQENEVLLPEELSETKPSFTANTDALAQLEGMGFPRNRCEKALHATGNSNADVAMEWLFAHMEDSDIDAPLDIKSGPAGGVDPDKVSSLADMMGFPPTLARQALRETGGDIERAADWLFSHPESQGEDEAGAVDSSTPSVLAGNGDLPAKFELSSIICHKGPSVHTGHYVAFIREKTEASAASPQWVLFNDENVVLATDVEEMKKFAYVYFFKRA